MHLKYTTEVMDTPKQTQRSQLNKQKEYERVQNAVSCNLEFMLSHIKQTVHLAVTAQGKSELVPLLLARSPFEVKSCVLFSRKKANSLTRL